MSCSLSSVESIAECIHIGVAAYGAINTLWGIGSGTLVAALLFIIKRWRDDRKRLTERVKELEHELVSRGDDDDAFTRITTVARVVRHWSHPKVMRSPNIDKAKDTLARSNSPIPGEEDLVALMDFTRLGSMTHFLAVTYEGLYWNNRQSLSWHAFVNSDINVTAKAVLIEGKPPIETGGGISSMLSKNPSAEWAGVGSMVFV